MYFSNKSDLHTGISRNNKDFVLPASELRIVWNESKTTPYCNKTKNIFE